MDSYKKMPLWQKIAIYLVIGGLVYFAIYYFVFAKKGAYTAPYTTTGNTETMAKNTVEIVSFKFTPATITVKVGDTVTFTNKDSVGHTATADDGSFDTGVFVNGESKSVTFSKAGTFAYHCSVHPSMKGTVIVTQ